METFKEFFTDLPQVTSFAHGRVNIIGEHTDYNGGYVLPICIPQATQVFLKARTDKIVRVLSRNIAKNGFTQFELGHEDAQQEWADYVKSITWILRKNGHTLNGFDALINSDVPIGSGLSSSAALEISLLRALNELFKLKLEPVTMAKYGQQAENEFVGARVGIMDQMVSALGQENQALFLDTRTLEYKSIPLDQSEISLLVINSGVSHDNAQGDYNQRRAECETAAKLLGVRELRDTNILDIEKSEMPEKIRARARHVVSENNRVLAAVKALESRDYHRLGLLFYESQNSMRDDFEISTPEIDLLISMIAADENVYGCRLTGAGFGGSVVALTKPGAGFQVAQRVLPMYRQRTGKVASLVIP